METKIQPTIDELLNGNTEEVKPALEELPKEEVLTPQEPAPNPEPEEKKKRGRPKQETSEPTPSNSVVEAKTLEQVLNEPQTSEEDTSFDFWNDVHKLSGEELEVDFGGVDPISPEGALIYAKAFREKGIQSFEETLASKYPLEYQALVMRSEGKDPSSLYTTGQGIDYSTFKLDEDDEDSQKSILRQDLKQQNISDKRIEIMIKSIYDSGDLYTEAQDSLKRLKDNQDKQFQEERLRIEEEKKETQKNIDAFSSSMNDIIKNGQIGDFVISDKDKDGFNKFLGENIRYVDGEFVAVIPLSKDSKELSKQLQTEYFRFKKGNLKDLVVKQAITENSKRLKANISEARKTEQGVNKRTDNNETWSDRLYNELGLKS